MAHCDNHDTENRTGGQACAACDRPLDAGGTPDKAAALMKVGASTVSLAAALVLSAASVWVFCFWRDPFFVFYRR